MQLRPSDDTNWPKFKQGLSKIQQKERGLWIICYRHEKFVNYKESATIFLYIAFQNRDSFVFYKKAQNPCVQLKSQRSHAPRRVHGMDFI